MGDEFETERHGPHDHPVIATLAGCAVLVAAAVLVPAMLPARPQPELIGAGIGAGFFLWLIGFVVTTRLSRLGWIAGSLAVLLAVGALSGFLIHRQYEAGVRTDPSSFAEMEFGPQGAPVLPKDAASRGPISRLFAAAVQAEASERREYDGALAKFGVGNLSSPYLLKQNPGTIARCADLEAIKPLVKGHATKRGERSAEVSRAIDGSQVSAPMKDALREITAPAGGDALLANQLAFLDSSGELCALLAKRGWYDANGYFGFNSGGDAARYKSLQARRSALASEGEKVDKDGAARRKQAQEKVRALLS